MLNYDLLLEYVITALAISTLCIAPGLYNLVTTAYYILIIDFEFSAILGCTKHQQSFNTFLVHTR